MINDSTKGSKGKGSYTTNWLKNTKTIKISIYLAIESQILAKLQSKTDNLIRNWDCLGSDF